MTAGDDARVEFLATNEPGLPPPRDSPARQRRYLILAAVILVGAALIGRAASSHTRPQTFASPAPGSAGTRTPSAVAAVGVDSCPKAAYCQSSPQVPGAVSAALRQYLPAFGATTVTSVTRKDAASDPAGLWSRLIETHSAAIDLLILIRASDAPRPTPSTGLRVTPPGLASAFLRTSPAGYEVDVQWTAPDTQPPPISALTALSKDSRLEALG